MLPPSVVHQLLGIGAGPPVQCRAAQGLLYRYSRCYGSSRWWRWWRSASLD